MFLKRIFNVLGQLDALHIFWYSMKRKDGNENYGDFLAPYLAEKISGKKIVRVQNSNQRIYRYNFFQHYFTVGSIIKRVGNNSIVWGSGISSENENVRNAKFLCTRGPRTRKRLMALGYDVPKKYGDPALLLPDYFPNVFLKKYELGIIPHFVDFEEVNNAYKNIKDVKVINLITDNVEQTTKEILECKNIVSSSLHGIIVSQAYKIPTLWVKFSNNLSGDNIKFYDYFESVGINFQNELMVDPMNTGIEELLMLLNLQNENLLADPNLLELRRHQLLQSCPYLKDSQKKVS